MQIYTGFYLCNTILVMVSSDHCSAVSDVIFQQCLRSVSSHQLSVPRHWLSTYGRRAFSVAGPHFLMTYVIGNVLQTFLDSC